MRNREKTGNSLSIFFRITGIALLLAALFMAVTIEIKDRDAGQLSKRLIRSFSDRELDFSQAEKLSKSSGDQKKGIDAEGGSVWPDPLTEMPAKEIDGEACIGILRIDDLGLELPVFRENTPLNLDKGTVLYCGSLYKKNMVICGHSYRSVFRYLDQLSYGSLLYFKDMLGGQYVFRLMDMEIIKPEDVNGMITGDWDLTLYTCTAFQINRLACRYELVAFYPPGLNFSFPFSQDKIQALYS